jgi:hypothetical protein
MQTMILSVILALHPLINWLRHRIKRRIKFSDEEADEIATRLALYCRFSLRSPRVELWSLICATHKLVTSQPGHVSQGKMLRRLANAGIGSQSPDHVIRNPPERLFNGDVSLQVIGVSMFWIALEESAEEIAFSISTLPPR